MRRYVLTGTHVLGVSPAYVDLALEKLGCYLERVPILG